MIVPKGYTEGEILEIIERVVNVLANKFTFGVYDLADIKQHGRLKALEAINSGKYKEGLPIDKFIYTHVRNRYMNLKRDKYSRNEPPCLKCPFRNLTLTSGCSEFNNKNNCELFAKWDKNNSAKKSLARPGDLTVNDDGEISIPSNHNVSDDAAHAELMRLIDQKLPMNMRNDWLRLKAGVKLNKDRTNEIYETVREIIDG